MNKGVAVQTIILVLVGLIVLVLLTYLIWTSFTEQRSIPMEECKSKFMIWCRSCGYQGWPDGGGVPGNSYELPSDIRKCLNDFPELGITAPAECDDAHSLNSCGKVGVL